MQTIDFGLEYKFVHTNKEDQVLYDSGWGKNQMSDDGFEQMFDIYFRGQATVPLKFQIGLAANTLLKNHSETDIVDVTGGGYARKDVARSDTGFPTLALDAADMEISSLEVEFENTGGAPWDEAVDGFLVASMSGADVFVSWKTLSVPRTLQPGDKLHVTIKQKGKEAV